MKKITKPGKDFSKNAKVVALVENLVSDLNGMEEFEDGARHFRWAVRWNKNNMDLRCNEHGYIAFLDFDTEDGVADYGLEVWEHKGDLFAVPGIADDGWTHRSMNGKEYEVISFEPVILEA